MTKTIPFHCHDCDTDYVEHWYEVNTDWTGNLISSGDVQKLADLGILVCKNCSIAPSAKWRTCVEIVDG